MPLKKFNKPGFKDFKAAKIKTFTLTGAHDYAYWER